MIINYDKKIDGTYDVAMAIKNESSEFEYIDVKPFGMRAGAIDLVTIVEFTIGGPAMYFGAKILGHFFDGFINGNAIKKFGEDTRNRIASLFRNTNNQKHTIAINAILLEKNIFIVLNHENISKELLHNIDESIGKLQFLIENNRIDLDDSPALQLYPCFEKKTWDYILCPTVDGFGNYINRIFKISSNEFIEFDSVDELLSYFPNLESSKIIIDHNRY